jgi:acetyl-CoA carboxylase beta subunit
MYVIIRCPLCRKFTYVDRFQQWKLCPGCGHAYDVRKATAYLDVGDFREAEHIIRQMEKHLHVSKKKDFTKEETQELRHHYAQWLRKKTSG